MKDKTREQLITELEVARKRIENLEELLSKRKWADEFSQILITTSPIGIYIVQDRNVKLVSPQFQQILGYTEAELLGMNALDIVVPEDREMVREEAIKMLKKERSDPYEFRVFTKDGKIRWVIETVTSIQFQGRRASLGNFMDITRQKELQAELVSEKERLAVTLRSIGDGVICTDETGHIVLMNGVAEKLTGWSEKEAIGRPLGEVFHIINEVTRERCENPVEKVLETGGVVGLANHTVLISKDGSERVLADSGSPIRGRDGRIIGVVLVFRDVTEKRKMEEELQKIEKLESIGVLAGGIAHDFNNILMGILGNITLAKMEVEPGSKAFERLSEAERASLRAKDLTQQLLTYSKGGAPVKQPASIRELLKDSASFALRGSNVRCEFSLPDDLWPVEVDEGQISQVISNIVINAQQAMPGGGIVKVGAENIVIGKDSGLPLKEGRYVKIAIKDQGTGIPKEHLSRIFDPYFTTKQKGSGLGLAIAHSIIRKHDGHISVESRLGEGSCFSIYLPACEREISKQRPVEEKPLVGKGRILVMDDEEIVRDVAGEILKAIGYEVEFARDGAEAIELYKKAKDSGEGFDALIMDLTIPGGMGGKETIEKLLEIDPEVKAIASSGYSNDPIMADFRKYGFSGVVPKPYKLQDLAKALHGVITNS